MKNKKLTWNKIIKYEPRLLDLYKRAKNIKDDNTSATFCQLEIWYAEFKPALLYLVGWSAKNLAVKSSEAYDTAYHKVLDAIPPCRGDCMCTWI